MATGKVPHPTIAERREVGKAARKRMPRSSLEGWEPASDRPDPVALLEEQDTTREPDLVPVRHGRMMVSPFTFYRGGAKDHGGRPGDDPSRRSRRPVVRRRAPVELRCLRLTRAHLALRPQRLRRDAPGPFEYDVAGCPRVSWSRPATTASPMPTHGASPRDRSPRTARPWPTSRRCTRSTCGTRDWMRRRRSRGASRGAKKHQQKIASPEKALAKARTKDSVQALSKLTEVRDGQRRIMSDPRDRAPAGSGINVRDVSGQRFRRACTACSGPIGRR